MHENLGHGTEHSRELMDSTRSGAGLARTSLKLLVLHQDEVSRRGDNYESKLPERMTKAPRLGRCTRCAGDASRRCVLLEEA
eukprot:4673736-Pleurochrysis_carterae.AAC.2